MSTTTSIEQAQDAVRTLLAWIGANPNDAHLQATPRRVVTLLQQAFSGYSTNAATEIGGLMPCEDLTAPVVLRDIPFTSICEHHMVPFTGTACIAYAPQQHLAGIAGIMRVLQHCSRRLHLQERLTRDVAQTLDTLLQPRGVLVQLRATHRCVHPQGDAMSAPIVETRFATGIYASAAQLVQPF